MQKLFLVVVSLLIIASFSFAQDNQRSEIFIGYSNLQGEGIPGRNDPNDVFGIDFFERRATLHGINAEFTGFPLKHFGITGDFSFHRKDRSADLSNGRDSIKTDTYYFMAGPSLKFRNTGRVEPFVRVMVGGAHTRFDVSTRRTSGTGTVTNSFETSSTDFAAALGGGLDVRLGERFSLRVFQVDYTPIFLRDRSIRVLGGAGAIQPVTLESQRQDNVRFSFGLVF
jgi:opacity protein-like surface antigen